MKRQFVRVPMCEAGCVLGSLCASPAGGWTASHELYGFPDDGRPSKSSILLATDVSGFHMCMQPLDVILGCIFLVCSLTSFLVIPMLWYTQLVQHQHLGMEVSL